jgi:hypothetical protein
MTHRYIIRSKMAWAILLLSICLAMAWTVSLPASEEDGPALSTNETFESAVPQLLDAATETLQHESTEQPSSTASAPPADSPNALRFVRSLPTVAGPAAPPVRTADAGLHKLDLGDLIVTDLKLDETPAAKSPAGDAPATDAAPTSLNQNKPAVSTPAATDEAADAAEPEKDTAEPDSATPSPGALTPMQKALRAKIVKALRLNYPQHLNSRDHNPWEMMHGLIAYGVDTKFFRNAPGGPTVNGAAYLCVNGKCHGLNLLYVEDGRIMVRKGPYVQGHYGQFLAILAQAHVPSDYVLRADGKEFTISDLIKSEMETCQAGTELTFKLISLAHYLPVDTTWKNDDGEEWSIPRLISEEIKQPILHTAACGGTHRLMGLSYALYKRNLEGLPIDGQYARAQKYLREYHNYAFLLQNPDGSFSTEWFKGKGNRDDVDRKVKTTGHILEWLSFSLPEEELFDARTVKAVNFLAGVLLMGPNHQWEVGPHGHALHALRIYERRAYANYSFEEPEARPEIVQATPEATAAPSSKQKPQRSTLQRLNPRRSPSQQGMRTPSPRTR